MAQTLVVCLSLPIFFSILEKHPAILQNTVTLTRGQLTSLSVMIFQKSALILLGQLFDLEGSTI